MQDLIHILGVNWAFVWSDQIKKQLNFTSIPLVFSGLLLLRKKMFPNDAFGTFNYFILNRYLCKICFMVFHHINPTFPLLNSLVYFFRGNLKADRTKRIHTLL
jgi:hypothetical protein